ncbi:uncharacterized protein PG998_008702 [Apiospora kogelbergensis]|uniref:uncharacterized protein n=1 Tax=Apiospora kogelbergensis TaxID=1337665 RepID=UPI00312D5D03
MRVCVTVSGICGAANQGLKSLDEYLNDKPLPACNARQEILQVALSEASAQSLMGTIRVLLEYGVDPEVNLLTSREWPNLADGWNAAGPSEWLPSFGQFAGEMRNFGERIWHQNVEWEQPKCEPDGVIIGILQELGVTWDEYYFDKAEQLSLWRKNSQEWRDYQKADIEILEGIVRPMELDAKMTSSGMDLMQAAVRKGCSMGTVQYMLDEGIPVHSKPCKVDGMSILHAALFYESWYQVEIVKMLLEHLTDIKTDPVWPRLLEMSMHLVCYGHGDRISDLFEYEMSRGVILPLPTDHAQAKQRFELLSKLLISSAPDQVTSYLWEHGIAFAQLHEEEHISVLEGLIGAGAYTWARNLIEQGIRIEGSSALSIATAQRDCPLWFIRYLLERDTSVTRPPQEHCNLRRVRGA